MKKVVAIILSLALAVPTASLLAQQAPTQVKQPVQVAQGGLPNFSLFGMGAAASIAVVVVAAALVYNAVEDDDDPVVAKAATATATR